jgi:alpha-methylacyl-CoA racemase
VPLNVVGDFGGGGLLLAFGMVCAILEARTSGQGQVVDAAIVDGAALLTTQLHAMLAQGIWSAGRERNLLDGGAHFYGVYECADGRHVAVGAIEPQFYARLLTLLGLDDDPEFLAGQRDQATWPRLRDRLAEVFRSRTRQEWVELLGDEDTCFAPVLSPTEAPAHPHNRARGTFAEVDGIRQPAPAPRFSRSGETTPNRPPLPGEHTKEILAEAGLTEAEIAALLADGTAA